MIKKEMYNHSEGYKLIEDNCKINDERKSFDKSKNMRLNSGKWCSLHKNTSHDTKDCFYKKSIKNKTRFSNKGSDEYRYRQLKIITEPTINLNAITLTGKINNQTSGFILDPGASRNFISKEKYKNQN
ncbi:hypothetical protein NAPIS_ORF00054 [Vairimorpha apis BRL 01]|uniref:Pol polyprotein n=1 Tax=Vairimorpha apis BRL 01 TaxID=1037528 RepID=T0LDL7_9MICR|nr:hypothetical protein NAPIS_ORF00054 [Vairimorpha apis BRL 01]